MKETRDSRCFTEKSGLNQFFLSKFIFKSRIEKKIPSSKYVCQLVITKPLTTID